MKAADRFKWTQPQKGDVVDGWKLIRTLGEGGNAVVWRARDKTAAEVALKLLKPPEKAERYDRFAREVAVHLDSLRDVEGVVPLIDANVPTGDVIETVPRLAMPIAEPLTDHLGDRPAVDSVVGTISQIADTLAYLLSQFAISHRDIKPTNLFWWNDRAAIGDFGLVAVPGGSGLTDDARDLGPRDFLPPEMRAGNEAREGPPADVFELALTTFLLLGGEPPRDGLRPEIESHSLTRVCGDPALAGLDRILSRATTYEPTERLSMADYASDLRAWLNPPIRPQGFDPQRYKRQLDQMNRAPVDHPLLTSGDLTVLQSRLARGARGTLDGVRELDLDKAHANVRLFNGWINGASVSNGIRR